jgi:hypothetical protein
MDNTAADANKEATSANTTAAQAPQTQAPVQPSVAAEAPKDDGAPEVPELSPTEAEDTSNAEQPAQQNVKPAFNPVTSAFHGASFAVGVLSGNSEAFKIQKATGSALDAELNKVQQQSANYKDQGALEDQKRLEKYKNQKLISFRL